MQLAASGFCRDSSSTPQHQAPLPSLPNCICWRPLPSLCVHAGKNKRISKGKKGGKKKVVDPFSKKDWYDIKAPSMFAVRNVGKTLVTRTQGTKVRAQELGGRAAGRAAGEGRGRAGG